VFPAKEREVYVPDTSVLIEGVVSKLIEQGVIRGKIIIHKAVLAELEHQANEGKVTGFTGLEEIAKLREMEAKGLVIIEIAGERPRPSDIKYAETGTIDALIRDFAYEVGATLVTGDKVQAAVARAIGMKVLYIPPSTKEKLLVDELFDDKTMSVHLKEGVPPKAKKGTPGYWTYENIGNRPLSREEIEGIAREIIEAAKRRRDGFIEIDRKGSTIVQLGDYRIIIVRPPLSDGWEITIVRPLVKLKLEDYNLPPKLMKRLEEKAEGILIAGAPGMGKTTFAQALAEYYMRKGKVVKTLESPRDMRLPAEVTQLSKAYGTSEELHDILLLSRPDYTVFDEMRDDADFNLYVDLRLAGIGMIGVVHATSPIDAIQRFLRRVELGMIPSIIDTVIFIEYGKVTKVYVLSMTVKLPTGLKEAELARPVVEIRDFLTGELEYEIYTFGEQTMVVPVKKIRPSLIETKIRRELEKVISIPGMDILIQGNNVILSIPNEYANAINRRILKKIKKLERSLGVSIRLRFL